MKTLKYFVIGALLTIVGTPANAQLDSKAAIDQVVSIIKSGAVDADKQIAKIVKPFKKDPATLTSIGRECLKLQKKEMAEEYANMAIAKNKNFGDAYILLGDVAINNDNGGKAAEMFQQAMYMDKKNPEGYRRYAFLMAKSSPSSSLDALEQLRANVPGYPVDVLAAEISDRNGDLKKAIEYYGKVEKEKLQDGQLASYATDLFLSGDYNKSLEMAQYGITRAPRSAAFNRLSLYNYTETKDYNKALEYADKLFNASDSAKFSLYDYQYVGHANAAAKNYDKAIEAYSKILTLDDATKDAKTEALKQIATSYGDKEDYVNGIPAYEKYLQANANATASDYAALGSMCTYYANSLTGDEQLAAIAKADKTYADLAAKFADAAEFAAYQRARVAGIVDPELKKGSAKQYYDQLIDIILKDGRIEGTSKTRLIQAYQYNMIYALQTKNDVATSKDFASKILVLDPANEQAKLVSTMK